MDSPFIGTIVPWAGTYVPRGWDYCWGQQYSLQQYPALYAILGTVYGGNGNPYFNLPDLRQKILLGAGAGPGLPIINPGQTGGAATRTMGLPSHTHTFGGTISAQLAVSSTQPATSATPSTSVSPTALTRNTSTGAGVKMYSPTSTVAGFDPGQLSISAPTVPQPSGTGAVGSGAPVNIMPPYLVMNYIICVDGIFPMRST